MRLKVFCFLSFFLMAFASAETLKVSFAQLPVAAESKEKGGYLVDFVKSFTHIKKDLIIDYDVVPFKRSISNIMTGKADLHAPLIKHPFKNGEEQGFSYSTVTIGKVVFALYVNKHAKKLDMRKLSSYKLETEAAHTEYFNFPIKPSACISCSLKKVNDRRIDGFIFSPIESDPYIKSEKLENLVNYKFAEFDVKFVLPLGERGKKLDAFLTEVCDKLKAQGKFYEPLGILWSHYRSWKPTGK